MRPVEWNESFLIGLPELDEDHRTLVRMVGDIAVLASSSCSPKDVSSAVDRLLERFHEHIIVEEAYLDMLTSPAGRDHRRKHLHEHTQFLNRVAAVQGRLANGEPVENDVDGLGVVLTLVELIRTDFEMVGMLRREGLLTADGMREP